MCIQKDVGVTLAMHDIFAGSDATTQRTLHVQEFVNKTIKTMFVDGAMRAVPKNVMVEAEELTCEQKVTQELRTSKRRPEAAFDFARPVTFVRQ